MIRQAYICDAIRTPFGRYGGALSSVRADDLGAIPIRALMARNPDVDWQMVADVIYGCANQAGEDNRNVARMSALLAGLPLEVPGGTVNRLCGSGLDALGTAARAIKSGEAGLMIAGGVESMSRAPFVMPKAESAFSRANSIQDTTIGWRFINQLMKERYGVDACPKRPRTSPPTSRSSAKRRTAWRWRVSSRRLQRKTAASLMQKSLRVTIAQKKGDPLVVTKDEHPRSTSLEILAKLKGVVRPDGTVTAGNASGVNDGACALLLADEATAAKNGLTPRARIVGMATAGVAPRIMGMGPAPATHKVLALTGLHLDQTGRDRTQRSLCRARPGRAAHARPARRRPARQRLGRRDCAGPSAGRQRRATGHHGGQPAAPDRRALRAVHHVHWRGPGHCRDPRTCLTHRSSTQLA